MVSFSPTNAASFSNVVVFASNGGNSTNALTGSGALVPTASFSASPRSGFWPLTVSFSDSSSGTITNRFWDFGDGTTTNTSATNLTHVYAGIGTNSVNLVVSGPVGSSSLSRSNYIVVTNLPPQLTVSAGSLDFGVLAVGQSRTQSVQVINSGGLTLSGTVSTAPPFNIQSGSPFNLGMGQTGSVVVTFSPTNAASFSNVMVFLSNDSNSTNTLTGVGAIAPVAGFTGTPISGLKPLTVNFTDSSTGTLTNRSWVFGDGTSTNTTATTFSHTYAVASTNTVSLTVSGPLGTNLLTRSSYIVATNLPPQLALSPTNLDFGLVTGGQSYTQSFQVVNSGGLTLTGSVSATLPFAIAGGSPLNIPAGQTGVVMVSFSPSNAASFSNA